MASTEHELLALAAEQFSDLTDAEKRLFRAVTAGEIANCRSPNDDENVPQYADTSDESRTIHAKVIRWLCVDREAIHCIDPQGINIEGATIEGLLDLANVTIPVPLALTRCAVKDGLILEYADIRTLSFSGSVLGTSHGITLIAMGVRVSGNVFLDQGFQAEGDVRLRGAAIGGDLVCSEGRFDNPSGVALDANGIRVAGGAHLDQGFQAEGDVRLRGAAIGGDLVCSGGRFVNPSGVALDANEVRVAGAAHLDQGFQAEGEVRVVNGRVGQLYDDEVSWPTHLLLDGFVYTAIAAGPIDATARLDWLARQPSRLFRPQPYEQLAKVLRESGHEADATRVLIAKERVRWRHRGLGWLSGLLNVTTGYGYKQWRALIWVGLWVAVGGILFGMGYDKEIVIPTKAEAYKSDKKTREEAAFYPDFNSWLYAFDTLVPIINFGQKDYWSPQVTCNKPGPIRGGGIRLCIFGIRALYLYRWLHIIVGWMLITLVVTAFTNLVRGERSDAINITGQ
jgi:hypothetical protein